MAESATSSIYDSKQEAEFTGDFVQMWLDALKQSDTEEDGWRKKAEKSVDTYRGKETELTAFNIVHSNIETICPALYNSTPEPDVRRRFSDPDPVGKAVADILERALRYAIDDYDFDDLMKSVIKDGELTGRGVPRVRYEPTFGKPLTDEMGQPVMGPDGKPSREVIYESVKCDYVPWQYFRRGPARMWRDLPWVAFGDLLTKDDVRRLNPEIAELIPYNYSTDREKKAGVDEKSIFRRALIWQIWDRDARRVVSICPEYTDEPVAVMDDPLGLTGFFPVPRPYQPVWAPDSLTPVSPLSIYESLVAELNEVTKRISRLVRQLRPRGGYAGTVDDIKAISEAEDGVLVQLTDVSHLEGGLEKWITWFPLDPTTKALQALLVQRDQIKQTIYEVTGIADILRGSTVASETATAQQIKTQWGSLRIQNRQQEVARVVRDLFRLKAEIISNKFGFDLLQQMTGLQYPTQAEKQQLQQEAARIQQQPELAQQIPPDMMKKGKELLEQPVREEVEQLLRSDILRQYRIDVESDSTIRADMTRNQEQMSQFLQGTSQFAASMGPIVAQSKEALEPVMEIYSAFARHYKLGKQAEDALARVIDLARKAQQDQKEQAPDPKVEAEKIKAQADQARTQMEMQRDQQRHQMEMEKMAADQQMMQGKLEIDRQRLAMDREKVDLERVKATMGQQPVMFANESLV